MAHKGFTMIEALLALTILCFSFTLLSSSLPVLKSMIQIRFAIEDEIALRQLRRLLLLSEDIQMNTYDLTFWYQDNWYSLIQDKDRLIRKEGYMIYMEGLEYIEFKEKGNCIYLYYEKENNSYERLLIC